MFQYKVLHNILYVKKMLFKLGKVTSLLCSFCKLHDETMMHLFYTCLIVKELWNELKPILSNNFIFLICTPQSAIFELLDLDTNEHLILNHLFSKCVSAMCNARTTGYLNRSHLLIYIECINDTKKKILENNAKRRNKFNKKWKNVLTN